MSITHTKVVVTADDGTSEVGTNEWNAAHTVDGPLDPNALAVGQETMPRLACNSTSVTCATGTLALAHFTASRTETCTKIRTRTGGTAAGATPTLCRVGLYTVGSTYTLVASIPNTTSLWAGTFTSYDTSLSVNYQVTAGVRYALGLLIVTGAATPLFSGTDQAPDSVDVEPVLFNELAGQSDLPATIAVGTLGYVGGGHMIYMVIKP